MASKVIISDESGLPVELSGETFKNGVGRVLQTVNTVIATQQSQTMPANADMLVGDVIRSIVPKGKDSNFLITIRWIGEVDSAWNVSFNVLMDGVRINNDSNNIGFALATPAQSYIIDNNSSTPETVNIKTLVYNSGSAVGVPIIFSLVACSGSIRTVWTNRCFAGAGGGTEAGTSEIIVMEIGA